MSAVKYDELRTFTTNRQSDAGHLQFCRTLREMSLSDITTSSSDSYDDSLNDSCSSRTSSSASDSDSDSDLNHRQRRQDQVISFYLDSTVTSSSSQSSSEGVDRRQFQTFYRGARSNGVVRSGMATTELESAGVVVDRTGNMYHGYKGELRLAIYMNSGLLTVHVQKGRYFTPVLDTERINVQLSLSVPESRDVCCCKTRDIAGSQNPLFNEKFSLELTEDDLVKRLVVSVWTQSCNSDNHANRPCQCVGGMSFGIRHIQQQRIDGWFYVLAADIGRFKHRRVCASRTRHHKNRKICWSRGGRQSMFAERLWVCVPDSVEGSRGFTITGSNPVFIAGVRIGSVADSAGLRPGDRIVSVNGTDVQCLTSNEVATAVRNASGKEIMIEIRRSFRKANHMTVGNSQQVNSCQRRQHDEVPAVPRLGNNHRDTTANIALPPEIPGKRSSTLPRTTQRQSCASSKGRKTKTISNSTNTIETVGSRKHRDNTNSRKTSVSTAASSSSAAAAAAAVTVATGEIVPRQLDRSPRRPRSIIAEIKRRSTVQRPEVDEKDESHYCHISHVDRCIPHDTICTSIPHDMTCANMPHVTICASIPHDSSCTNIPHDTTCASISHDNRGIPRDSVTPARSLPLTPAKNNPLDLRTSKPESDNDGHTTSPEVTNIHRLSAGRYVYLTGLRTDVEFNNNSVDRCLTNVGEVYNVTSRCIGQLFRDVTKPPQSRKSLFITSTPANDFHIGDDHSKIKCPAITSSSSDGIYELMLGRPPVESHYVDMSSVLGHRTGSPPADVTVVSALEQGSSPEIISGRSAVHGSERRPDVCPNEEFLHMATLDDTKENLYEVLNFDAVQSTPKKPVDNHAATMSREAKSLSKHRQCNSQQNGKNCKMSSPTTLPNDRLDPLGLLQFAGTPSVGCSGIYAAGKSRSPDVIQPLLESNCEADGDPHRPHDVETAQTQCSETAVACRPRGGKKGKTAVWPIKYRKVSIKEFFGRLR